MRDLINPDDAGPRMYVSGYACYHARRRRRSGTATARWK